jgi:hypothetical protein
MRATAARNGLSKWLIVGGRLTATVLIAAFVYRRVNWAGLEGALRSARPVSIACAALLQGGSLALLVTQWRCCSSRRRESA